MAEHPRPRVFTDYLSGFLDASAESRFEAHVEACPPCAARLQAEASLEMLLYAAAEPPPVSRLPPLERVGRVACTLMAAAAAMLFVLTDPTRYLALHAADPEMAALATDDTVCLPPVDGGACEEPLTVAMATMPPGTDGLGWDLASSDNECWLGEQGIDPLCVSTDPLAG